MSTDTDSLTVDTAASVLAQACAKANLPADDAELIRIGTNAVYRLPGGTIARIARPSTGLDAVVRQVHVARWLQRAGYPATRALDIAQPIVVADRPVTFWVSVSDTEEYATLPEIARLFRELHALPAPTGFTLPPMEPISDLTTKLTPAEELDAASTTFLRDQVDNVCARYEALNFALPVGPIHGDANIGNVIRSRTGEPVLIDLDSFAVGHREWDLVQTALFYERFGWHTEPEYRAFVSEYGYDIMKWDGYPTLADYRELSMTLWLCGKLRETPDVADEVRKRIESIKNRGSRREWAPF